MDKLGEKKKTAERIKKAPRRLLALMQERGGEKISKESIIKDVLLFTVGFLLSRCHVVFGAHPLGLAFVSAIPFGVWQLLGGAAVGALSMGMDGIIFAATTAIAAFLRAAISCERSESCPGLFREGILLRMSVSVLCGFISAVYEVLLKGLSEATILFGIAMVILPPAFCFIFSGTVSSESELDTLLFGEGQISALRTESEEEGWRFGFFSISSLALLLFLGLSFKGVELMGISASYILASVATLFFAKRFGPICGMLVGFACSLGTAGIYSVGFALLGLGCGWLFPFGAGYAVALGGGLLVGFCTYAGGLSGLVSSLPEYAISAAVALPFLGKTKKEEKEDDNLEDTRDMVGTMALVFQNRRCGALDSISPMMESLAELMREKAEAEGHLSFEEYREIVTEIAKSYCIGCESGGLCAEETRPTIRNADKIAHILRAGGRISGIDVNSEREFCDHATKIAKEINEKAAEIERERYLTEGKCNEAEEYFIISSILAKAAETDEEERRVDLSLTAPLTEAIRKCGIEKGTIRAFGRRRKHFILAAEDGGDGKITSFALRQAIEQTAGVKLSAPEYYSRGNLLLMECSVRRACRAKIATATLPRSEREVSGDTVISFETDKDYFYALLSDGMGSGEEAKRTSTLTGEYMRRALSIGAAKEEILLLLNRVIRARREECSTTVDLFELDMLNHKVSFIKCGAATSFIKRGSSLFRIRANTTPIGLTKTLDAEKIRADVQAGDYIIMMSDGICDGSEDDAWLLLLLGAEPPKSLTEFASKILSEAKRRQKNADDMTVAVIQIDEI